MKGAIPLKESGWCVLRASSRQRRVSGSVKLHVISRTDSIHAKQIFCRARTSIVGNSRALHTTGILGVVRSMRAARTSALFERIAPFMSRNLWARPAETIAPLVRCNEFEMIHGHNRAQLRRKRQQHLARDPISFVADGMSTSVNSTSGPFVANVLPFMQGIHQASKFADPPPAPAARRDPFPLDRDRAA